MQFGELEHDMQRGPFDDEEMQEKHLNVFPGTKGKMDDDEEPEPASFDPQRRYLGNVEEAVDHRVSLGNCV